MYRLSSDRPPYHNDSSTIARDILEDTPIIVRITHSADDSDDKKGEYNDRIANTSSNTSNSNNNSNNNSNALVVVIVSHIPAATPATAATLGRSKWNSPRNLFLRISNAGGEKVSWLFVPQGRPYGKMRRMP